MKSYNPFKMWGSYLGGLVLGLLVLISATSYYFSVPTRMCGVTGIASPVPCTNSQIFTSIFFNTLIWAAIGFLLSWAIHSLIRKLRK